MTPRGTLAPGTLAAEPQPPRAQVRQSTLVGAAVDVGLMAELFHPAGSAAVADLPARERLRAFGLLFWAANLGVTVSAMAAGVLVRPGHGILFRIGAAASVLAALIVWRHIPETRRPTPKAARRALLPVLLRDPVMLAMAAIHVVYLATFLQAFCTLPLVMAAGGYGPETYGAVLALNGIVIVVVQPIAVRLLGGRDRASVLAVSMLLVGVGGGLGAVAHGTASQQAVAPALRRRTSAPGVRDPPHHAKPPGPARPGKAYVGSEVTLKPRESQTGRDQARTKEYAMFAETKAFSAFAVGDLAQARKFYGEILGVRVSGQQRWLTLHLAGGRDIRMYAKLDHTPATYTVLMFHVGDIEAAASELAKRIVFDRQLSGYPPQQCRRPVPRRPERLCRARTPPRGQSFRALRPDPGVPAAPESVPRRHRQQPVDQRPRPFPLIPACSISNAAAFSQPLRALLAGGVCRSTPSSPVRWTPARSAASVYPRPPRNPSHGPSSTPSKQRGGHLPRSHVPSPWPKAGVTAQSRRSSARWWRSRKRSSRHNQPDQKVKTTMNTTYKAPIVTPAEWEAARQRLLVKEEKLTRARDAMAAERRRMPWVAVETPYEFDGPSGRMHLADLFEGRRQLLLYRAFFEPGVHGWPGHACVGCSLMADQVAHLAHLYARDITFAFASRAPQPDIERVKARMGWTMPWYTITDGFDADFGVDEWYGTNAFVRDGDRVYRTYFINFREHEPIGGTWSTLDIAAFGRQEDWEDSPEGYPQDPQYSWLNWHDSYGPGKPGDEQP